MYDRFVKLPMRVLSMDISAEAKLLYSILADRVAYSQFEDERGRYYFLSSADREDLMRRVGCAVCAYKRHMKLLRDRGMIYTHQHRNGVRIYIDEVVSNQYSEVVSKLSHPLNHNTKLEKQENYTDSEQNIITAHNGRRRDIIAPQRTSSTDTACRDGSLTESQFITGSGWLISGKGASLQCRCMIASA